MNSLLAHSARELAAGVARGEFSPADLLRAYEQAAQASGAAGALNAVIHSDIDHVAATLAHHNNSRGALAGVPIVVKDNIATLRMPTSCGSRMLEHYVSPFASHAVECLERAGALVVGKTNMDEFAMGSSTENSAFGPTRNPVDDTRVPGGSSGGSAAAVAAGITPVALGSETGGSVRQPAAFCGIVGIKPTYGAVSRRGLVAFASSLDQIGVFGRTVDDAALALEVIAQHDPLDATSRHMETRSAARPSFAARRSAVTQHDRPLEGCVIGLPREYFPADLDRGIAARIELVAGRLRTLGADVREVSLPHTELAVPVYYIIAPAEASSNLARFDGVRFGLRAQQQGLEQMYETTRSLGFGAEVRRRILLGTYVLSAGYYDAYYRRAQQVRQRIADDFTSVFSTGVDLLLTPTTPTTAFTFGSRSAPYDMYLSDIFTVTANLAGLPAMSLPVGRIDGLPVGAQIIAPHFGEADMLMVARHLEASLGEEAHR